MKYTSIYLHLFFFFKYGPCGCGCIALGSGISISGLYNLPGSMPGGKSDNGESNPNTKVYFNRLEKKEQDFINQQVFFGIYREGGGERE